LPGDEFESELSTRIDPRARGATPPPPSSLPPPIPPPSPRGPASQDSLDWHLSVDGQQEGPLSRAALAISAVTGQGIPALLHAIDDRLRHRSEPALEANAPEQVPVPSGGE
jgi:hypothetical protein